MNDMNDKIKPFNIFNINDTDIVLIDGNKCVRKVCMVRDEKEKGVIRVMIAEAPTAHIKETYERLLEGHLCGYVALLKSEVPITWHGNYDAIPSGLDIHGGVTYCIIKGDYIIFGFDCNHFMDNKNPDMMEPEFVMGLVRDMERELLTYVKDMMGTFKPKELEDDK